MKINFSFFVFILILTPQLFGQDSVNCFLEDFEPKTAVIPLFENVEKPSSPAAVVINVNVADTLGRVSKYIFGNALAVWIGSIDLNNNPLVSYLQKLSPTLIRYPGGSWSDIFFWNGNPGDLPDSLYDGTNRQKYLFEPQFGTGSWPTTLNNYYALRDSVNNTEGLITINYAYARYGLGTEPVKQAAHYAADWVRYDNGRTRFWEIGNENGAPWEAGWLIDTHTNQDGQPDTITGELYGQHFKIFADSMRAAAAEIGATIFIGGQILHYDGTNSWNVTDETWNEGFFNAVGEEADFYVIHNYYGTEGNVNNILNAGVSEPNANINFIRQDIKDKQAADRPVALTEWNVRWDLTSENIHRSSNINGMQAVIISCEMIKLNYGMSSRWLIANWESDGMFYKGNSSSIPEWNPRPDVFYMYYLQKFTGDHSISASSNNNNVLVYATTFSLGETGIIVINKGNSELVVKVQIPDHTVGERFYIYSLTGGIEATFSQTVNVNDEYPVSPLWGPIDELENILARGYSIDGEIKFSSPRRSVQFIMVESGNNSLAIENKFEPVKDFALNQNYPNPFNPQTSISYSLPSESLVNLKVYDLLGREVATLIQNKRIAAGNYSVNFDAESALGGLSTGIYFYKIEANDFVEIKKMILIK